MPDIVDWQQPPRPIAVCFSSFWHPCDRHFQQPNGSIVLRLMPCGSVRSVTGTYSEDSHSSMDILCGIFCCRISFLYGWFLALRRAYQSDLPEYYRIVIGGQTLKLPVARILHLLGLVVSLLIAVVTGASNMMEWPTFALYWYATRATGWRCGSDLRQADQLLSVRSARMAAHHGLAAIASRTCLYDRRFLHFRYWQYNNSLREAEADTPPGRGAGSPLRFGFLLLVLAMRAYIARFERLFDETYDLWRRHLHGCARHASWNARSLRRACSWCCDCNHQRRGGPARALVGGSSRSSRSSVISRFRSLARTSAALS